MEDDELKNLLGGDYDDNKKISWEDFTKKRVENMKKNEPQFHAFNKILSSVRQENPKKKLFFLEGILNFITITNINISVIH